MTTPADNVHRIADRPPEFPCWIYCPTVQAEDGGPYWCRFENDPTPEEDWSVPGWTHWHPDQPEAPTVMPGHETPVEMAFRAMHPKPAPSPVEVPQWASFTDEELREHIVTLDGRGKVFKEGALNELLRRHAPQASAPLVGESLREELRQANIALDFSQGELREMKDAHETLMRHYEAISKLCDEQEDKLSALAAPQQVAGEGATHELVASNVALRGHCQDWEEKCAALQRKCEYYLEVLHGFEDETDRRNIKGAIQHALKNEPR